MGTVQVEVLSWVTKFVGGDGTGRKVFEESLAPGATVRSVLERLSARYPELRAALWEGQELGAHIEVLVNDAMLGVTHALDSPLRPGDRVALLGQFTGGSRGTDASICVLGAVAFFWAGARDAAVGDPGVS